MKVLFISRFGDSYGLASHIALGGHDVFYWIEDKKYRMKGKGFDNPKRIDFYEPYLDKADVILFDMSEAVLMCPKCAKVLNDQEQKKEYCSKCGDFKQASNLAEKLKKQGYPVLGGSVIADRLEKERAYAQDIIKEYCPDVIVTDYEKFKSIKAGISFLEAQEEPYCFKPDNMPTNWTLVPRKDSNGWVIKNMSRCKENTEFILQKKIQGNDVIEISTEGWMDANGKFVPGMFNHTMEQKRFLNGDWGPQTGCMGSVVWRCGEDELVKMLLLPLEGFFAEHGHVGPVDINVLITEEGVHFLEFSARFGYDAIQNLALLMDDAAEYFKAIATGEGSVDLTLDDGYSVAVRLSVSPYPETEDKQALCDEDEGMNMVNVPDYLEHQVMLCDVMKDKNGMIVMAGSDNIIGVACSTGDSIEQCREMLYGDDGIINDIVETSDVQCRTDIGERAIEQIEKLKEWGYLDGRD